MEFEREDLKSSGIGEKRLLTAEGAESFRREHGEKLLSATDARRDTDEVGVSRWEIALL